jgi:hypothetical protein
MICFQDEKATIEYLVADQAIFCAWYGDVPSEQFRQVMQLKLQHMQFFLALNWLLDIRYMQAISYDDQQWLLENWIHELLKLPIRKIAIIPSLDVYNNMVMEEFLRYKPEDPACEVQLFADREASLDWIREFAESSFPGKTGTA